MPRRSRYALLRDVIHLLAPLTHDELRDLKDMLHADLDPNHPPSRKGLPPVEPNNHALILYGGWQYREQPPLYTSAARLVLRKAYDAAALLPADAKEVIADVAALLEHANAPIPERRRRNEQPIGSGTIQTKIITRRKLNLETGEVEAVGYGPYLYYRVWTTGGDTDKRTRRLSNDYIGEKELAQLFDETEPASPERRDLEARIIAAHLAGTIKELKVELGLIEAEDNSAARAALGNQEISPNTALFLPDYIPAPTRKQRPPFFALTDVRREVLATYAAGLNYAADNVEGIERRKMARQLVEAGLLAEVTGYTDHRKHNWKLTEAGLNLIRSDEDLQRRVSRWLS